MSLLHAQRINRMGDTGGINGLYGFFIKTENNNNNNNNNN